LAFGKKKKEEETKEEKIDAPQNETEKFKRLFGLSTKLDKEFGTTNSLIRMDSKKIMALPSICTGLSTVDYQMLQCGGIPRGRIVEIFGSESAGKTSFTLHIVGEEQKQGGIAAFIDAEHTLDPQYAAKLGVNVDKLLVSQPDYGEQALTIVEELILSQSVSLIVVDSAAALVPKSELEGDMGQQHVGLQARMMSQAMRKLSGIAFANKVTVIFTNQLREKIGTLYGNPETTPTGRALKHYASVRIDVRRKEAITISGKKEDPNIIGHGIRLKAVKNKVGVPFRETVVDLYYEDGFDKIGNLIEYGSDLQVFEMAGSWYSFDFGHVDDNRKPVGVERFANGLSAAKEYFREYPEDVLPVAKRIEQLVRREAALPTGV
jgi:recombination protein RecA